MENRISFKEWAKKVAKTNKAFNKANYARKRVMICKDILAALDAELFRAPGQVGYFETYSGNGQLEYNKELRDELIKKDPVCTVCAKGGIMTCIVMRRDHVKVNEVNCDVNVFKGDALAKKLGNIFTAVQLDLIERHYELWRVGYSRKSAFERYMSGTPRYRAILNNMIRNKGTFKPHLEEKQNPIY